MDKKELLEKLGLSDDQLEEVSGGLGIVKSIRCINVGEYEPDGFFTRKPICDSCNQQTAYSKCFGGNVVIDISSCPSLAELSFPSRFQYYLNDFNDIINGNAKIKANNNTPNN